MSIFSAQFGQFAGAVINAEIKSGTNQLHGSLWEYWRNEALNVNGYFNNQHHVRKPKYRQNQYGGTIGGPVYIPHLYDGRNKSFFFFDYQHTGVTKQANYTQTIPTALMQSSGFTNLQDMITGNFSGNKRAIKTDGLGRKFNIGTVLDPATPRTIAPGAFDPISGLTNNGKAAVTVRDPFYTGPSITYGKCMSNDNGKAGLGGGYRAEWLPGFGIGPDYSLCTGDATHLFHASGEYRLSFWTGERFGGNMSRWADAVVGGWQFNYIFTYQSGQPINIGCPQATTSDFGCNANKVAGVDPYAGPHNATPWLNRDAFAAPPTATAVGQADYSPLGGKPYPGARTGVL